MDMEQDREEWRHRIIRLPEVMWVTGLSRNSVLRLEQQGLFPRSRQLGPRAKGWVYGEVRDWVDSRPPSGEGGLK